MEDYSEVFRTRLASQAEACARKTLERLQKDLQGNFQFSPDEVYYLANAAETLLRIRDLYGKK